MLTREKILELLQAKYPFLATEFGVSKIGLFGSFAKGQPDETSDMDIVMEFDHPIGFKFIDLVEYLENLLGRKVEVLTPAGIQGIRIERVAKSIAETDSFQTGDHLEVNLEKGEIKHIEPNKIYSTNPIPHLFKGLLRRGG
jgi:predicted nucleotidyltransferase